MLAHPASAQRAQAAVELGSRRSPGKSGEVTTAMSGRSNRPGWMCCLRIVGQDGDPAQVLRLEVLVDARLGDHAAVAGSDFGTPIHLSWLEFPP